jgi:hypothetical protein
MTDDSERKPVDRERPDDPEATPPQPDPNEDGETVPEVLTREGADAPDAADIEDPDAQL